MRIRSIAAFAFCLLLLAVLCSAPARTQDHPNKEQDKDKPVFLVARPEMGDPIFRESVVLLFPASAVESDGGEPIVIGLIVNRQGKVGLSDFFPEEKSFRDRTENAYFGGPVAARSFCALFRSPKDVKQAVQLFGDVYITFDGPFIKEHLKKPGQISDLRIFVGRSQWSPEQLEGEMELGAWYKVPAETNLIFSPNPELLWHNLLQRANPGPIVKGPQTLPQVFPSLAAHRRAS